MNRLLEKKREGRRREKKGKGTEKKKGREKQTRENWLLERKGGGEAEKKEDSEGESTTREIKRANKEGDQRED